MNYELKKLWIKKISYLLTYPLLRRLEESVDFKVIQGTSTRLCLYDGLPHPQWRDQHMTWASVSRPSISFVVVPEVSFQVISIRGFPWRLYWDEPAYLISFDMGQDGRSRLVTQKIDLKTCISLAWIFFWILLFRIQVSLPYRRIGLRMVLYMVVLTFIGMSLSFRRGKSRPTLLLNFAMRELISGRIEQSGDLMLPK